MKKPPFFQVKKIEEKTPWWAFGTSPTTTKIIWSHGVLKTQPSQKTNPIPPNRTSSGPVFTRTVFEFVAVVIHEKQPTWQVFDFWTFASLFCPEDLRFGDGYFSR